MVGAGNCELDELCYGGASVVVRCDGEDAEQWMDSEWAALVKPIGCGQSTLPCKQHLACACLPFGICRQFFVQLI